MALTVNMPQLGESVTEGTIARWLKQPGEQVAKYESIAEVITDKVNAEIPAPADGTMGELIAAEGAVVAVGQPICTIDTGEGSAGGPSPDVAETQPAAPSPQATADAQEAEQPQPAPQEAPPPPSQPAPAAQPQQQPLAPAAQQTAAAPAAPSGNGQG
ncbi:MAG TPA: biotin/lipoyl-containing protein, partial [Candidatus Dormibacteraeota bacterium]|nr:biotin/lipoyl-containing protein [Candidatus Dormibacteraeota bacterium]